MPKSKLKPGRCRRVKVGGTRCLCRSKRGGRPKFVSCSDRRVTSGYARSTRRKRKRK